MNSKYNYDINDEFNQMLINIMEGIYEKKQLKISLIICQLKMLKKH